MDENTVDKENEEEFAEESENNDSLESNDELSSDNKTSEIGKATLLSGMYQDWFLDYASYVILERAVPEMRDGLKPVQRRILHSMKDLDDGRYNKVANIIGHTMKYHPHGDASIGDALVQLGQKELLIDTQGNWGNTYTGDSAAAPRYIEARLSKFALEVVFNPKTTVWKNSYDGRNKEPVTLPVKFPLLLAQGVEGIAVGLASKILPHNFIELIDASINILKGEKPNIYPDFLTGGFADFSKYNGGQRGGRVRVRAKISQIDKKTLVISELPFGSTTTSLIDSIINANDKGKIKIRKIDDNTSSKVEILVHLVPGISPDQTIDALYAFTDCEISIATNCCVIEGSKPRFVDVNEMLMISTDHTVELLNKELEIEKFELLEQLLYSSLEKIFIENRIYRKIENCETWEAVLSTIDKGLDPFKDQFYREITQDDILRLTEIKIKRISKFDSFKADEIIKNLNDKLEKVNYNLAHLIEYAIKYFEHIKDKYGKGRERKTEIRFFDTIEAQRVAVSNVKLYVNREEGFAGTSLRKDEFVCDCSDLDDIIVFKEDGTFVVTKVADKSFVGKNIIHIDVFEKNDDRTIYNMIYSDGPRGAAYMKRFPVKGITRDKEYDLTKGTTGSKVNYFTANKNGEAEVVTVYLRHKPKLKKPVFDFDFSELAIKGRSATGNLLTKHQIRKVVLKDQGVSTLSALNIWFDDTVLRLNTDKRGKFLGAFKDHDKLIALFPSGTYKITNFDISNRFDEPPVIIEKFNPEKVYSAVYIDGETRQCFIKRFPAEESDKIISFIGDFPDNKLLGLTGDKSPQVKLNLVPQGKQKKTEEIVGIAEFIGVKSYKAKGKRASGYDVESMEWLEPLEQEEEVIAPEHVLADSESIENKQGPEPDNTHVSGEAKQITLDLDID
ncbi:MAG: DNA gyrase/topoisomerase IV subunit A [Bacteroidetes bacterium]|nr:DNA gyrase/topoisomerase IV subunit A [Bacteroidota bacterium]